MFSSGFFSRELIADRLERLSIPEPMSGCLLWIGSAKVNASGIEYGKVTIGPRGAQKTYAAHRVSFALHKGPIPDGINVCHHCDLGLCIEPNHLFLGSQQDNMRDAQRKGRKPIAAPPAPKRIGPPLRLNQILSQDDVLEIRRSDDFSKALAERFGVHAGYIRRVRLQLSRKSD